MKQIRTIFKIKYIILLSPVVIFLIFFAVLQHNPRSNIYASHIDVDISTGRLRRTKYIMFIRVSSKIKQTCISKLILSKNSNIIPDWRPSTSKSSSLIQSNYPLHPYHRSIGIIHIIDGMFSDSDMKFESGAKYIIAKHIISLWKIGGDDRMAYRYLNKIFEYYINTTEMKLEKINDIYTDFMLSIESQKTGAPESEHLQETDKDQNGDALSSEKDSRNE